MSPPAYERIPQEEKPPPSFATVEEEERTSYLISEPSCPPDSNFYSTIRTCIKAVICSLLLFLTVGACLMCGALVGKGLADIVQPGGGVRVETVTKYVTVTEKGNWKWWNKRTAEAGGEGGEYSTSTLRDGSTQTFVFTTRPIVNPGGYTIGTLTGYVPVSTASQDAGPTTTAEPTSTQSSSSSSSSSSAIRSASTIPQSSSTHKKTSSLPPRTETPSTSDSWSRVSTTSLPVATPTSASIVERAPTTSASEEFDFSGVDYHLLHRRGLDFEDPSASEGSLELETTEGPSSVITSIPLPTTTSSATGVEEFSTSTDRRGEVYTLVKTTRPIRNPGGYTIGTLDGGWVDVNKVKPTPTAAKRSPHEELKKREVINL